MTSPATEPLNHVWTYTDVDRAFWQEHLEDWVPARLVDAHIHVMDPAFRLEEPTEARRRQYWVNEVSEPIGIEALDHALALTYPGRDVTCVALGWPSLDFDVAGGNAWLQGRCSERGWPCLAVVRPAWTAAEVGALLDRPGVIGFKPYYALIGHDALTRDAHLEASIFDFMPPHQLDVLDDRRGWLTLHVPRADRLGHPGNLRELRELRRRWPGISVVIAHLGRCYTEEHAREALPAIADDPGLYVDTSAVMNPASHRVALEQLGPARLLYGSDNPVFYMRGRRQYRGRAYINRTNWPFHFNVEREPPEVEAAYTLYMYEDLRALKQACEEAGVTGRADIEAMFRGNAERLIGRVRRSHAAGR